MGESVTCLPASPVGGRNHSVQTLGLFKEISGSRFPRSDFPVRSLRREVRHSAGVKNPRNRSKHWKGVVVLVLKNLPSQYGGLVGSQSREQSTMEGSVVCQFGSPGHLGDVPQYVVWSDETAPSH